MRDVADIVVCVLLGNAGFGPLAACLLDLKGLFAFTANLNQTPEIVAGLFEIVLGALSRQQEKGLLEVICNWGFFVLLSLSVLQHIRGQASAAEDFLRDLMGTRAEMLSECRQLPGYDAVFQKLIHSVESLFEDRDARFLFGDLPFFMIQPDNAFESFMQDALQGIVRNSFVQAQTPASSSSWPPEPSRKHVVLHPAG